MCRVFVFSGCLARFFSVSVGVEVGLGVMCSWTCIPPEVNLIVRSRPLLFHVSHSQRYDELNQDSFFTLEAWNANGEVVIFTISHLLTDTLLISFL